MIVLEHLKAKFPKNFAEEASKYASLVFNLMNRLQQAAEQAQDANNEEVVALKPFEISMLVRTFFSAGQDLYLKDIQSAFHDDVRKADTRLLQGHKEILEDYKLNFGELSWLVYSYLISFLRSCFSQIVNIHQGHIVEETSTLRLACQWF